nr:radical SAM protein [Fervidicoccus fontis]
MSNLDIVITTDRTMMSNHHGREFLGFVATGPSIGLPEFLWTWISSPKPKIKANGEPNEAPYGLRKVEAVLLDKGYNASIIDPSYLNRYADTSKLLLVGHHDFFAYGPPSNEWWLITGREPVNRKSFRRLMESPAVKKMRRRGVKIIAGGPAAWQWLYEVELWKKWGVTSIFDGEAERILPNIIEKALNNEELPFYIYAGSHDSPSIEEIPTIKKASVNGLIEIMRGCPRGCKFCSVTLRPLRYIPLEKIEEEVLVNVRNGVTRGLIHSEDILLYGADGVKPRPDPVLKLHDTVLKHVKSLAWSHASLAAIKYAEEEHKLITKVMEKIREKQDYIGVEVGVETGGYELAKKIMPAKSAPYKPEKWHEVVEDAFRIMHENNIIPAATLIIGLPEETEKDVMETIELIEKLRPYRSLIVPMLFVPMGNLKHGVMFKREMLKDSHIELMFKILDHSIYWSEEIMNHYYLKSRAYYPLKFLLRFFIGYVKRKTDKIRKNLIIAST